VIGKGAYAHMPALPNPANDAADMAPGPERLGFDVTLGLDAARADMEDLLDRFARSAAEADAALVFFAGHGLQHQGENYSRARRCDARERVRPAPLRPRANRPR